MKKVFERSIPYFTVILILILVNVNIFSYLNSIFLIPDACAEPSPEVQGVSESSSVVEIVSHSYYVEMGYSYVVGEVLNNGSQNLEYVELSVTFYDSDDNVLSTAFTFVELEILKPHEKSPFEVNSFPDENLPVYRYKITVADHSVTSATPYRDLKIKGVTTGTEYGYYTIRGEVENVGEIDATFVEVIATYYDAEGIVIGTSFTFTNPEDVDSGRTAPFEMTTFPRTFTPDTYFLQVESSETVYEPGPTPEPSPEPEPGPTPEPSPGVQGVSESSNAVEIVSHSYYVDMGYSYIVGEVQNVGSKNLEFVELTVTFYDKDNSVLSTGITFSQIDVLVPQQLSPFVVSSFPEENLAVDHYKIAVSNHFITSTNPYRKLDIQGVTTGTEYGYYIIRGEIENTGSIKTTFVEVVVTYYDDNGIVMGTSFSFTNPEEIDPGKAAPFEITNFPQTFTPASYKLQVECIESTPTPSPTPTPTPTPTPSPTPTPTPSPTPTPPEQEGSRCIIATTTYGSELSPEVQFLRGFRDDYVLSTYAGKNFMTLFDAWYYTFSPKVASMIAVNNGLRGFMKIYLYPLIGILHISSMTYPLYGLNPELAIVISGFVASSLIGIVYFMPIGLILFLITKKKAPLKILQNISLVWFSSIGFIATSEIIISSSLMVASTSLFVLTTLTLATLISGKYAMRFIHFLYLCARVFKIKRERPLENLEAL